MEDNMESSRRFLQTRTYVAHHEQLVRAIWALYALEGMVLAGSPPGIPVTPSWRGAKAAIIAMAASYKDTDLEHISEIAKRFASAEVFNHTDYQTLEAFLKENGVENPNYGPPGCWPYKDDRGLPLAEEMLKEWQ